MHYILVDEHYGVMVRFLLGVAAVVTTAVFLGGSAAAGDEEGGGSNDQVKIGELYQGRVEPKEWIPITRSSTAPQPVRTSDAGIIHSTTHTHTFNFVEEENKETRALLAPPLAAAVGANLCPSVTGELGTSHSKRVRKREESTMPVLLVPEQLNATTPF